MSSSNELKKSKCYQELIHLHISCIEFKDISKENYKEAVCAMVKSRLQSHATWVQILALLTNYVTLTKILTSLCLRFLLCKMEIIMISRLIELL